VAGYVISIILFDNAGVGSSGGGLVFIEENPDFNVNGGDRHYSNGAQIQLLSACLEQASGAGVPLRCLAQITFLFLPPAQTKPKTGWNGQLLDRAFPRLRRTIMRYTMTSPNTE
jgi:hypothetical protein